MLSLQGGEETRSFTHFSKTPSNSMVRKMLNLRRTVNMGKLEDKTACCILFHVFLKKRVWIKYNNLPIHKIISAYLSRCVPNSPDI